MFAGLFARRRRATSLAVRRQQRRPATVFEALEPRLALAVTLVIDPSNLKLPATSSAWVAGYANVQGGKAGQPFTWLAANGSNAAHFVVPPSTTGSDAALPMIQIWGGDVSGTTTITIDTAAISSHYANPQLAGGQLQIFVSPTNTPPSGPTLSGSVAPITNVAVTQVNSPPYLSSQIAPGMVPFDLVEFTYLPGQSSTFDLTAVNGFVVPMTLTTTDPQQQMGSTSIGTQPTGISRHDIGIAFGKFMTNDPQGGNFTQLLYGPAASAPFAAPPTTPANQFFAIASPWFWIANQNNQRNATPAGLNSYWDKTLDTLFRVGNILKIDVGTSVGGTPIEYTGTSSLVNGVSTYSFKDQSGNPVMNTVTNQPLMLPKPSDGYDAASFVFGNTLQYQSTGVFPDGKFPGGDGNLIINSIMESLNRGVALDGLNPTPIGISQATSTSFSIPSPGENPVGVATITTVAPHGLPPNGTERVIISGVNVPGYNGTQPAPAYELTVTGPNTFTFTYNIDQLPVNYPNNTTINNVVPGTYNSQTNKTPATVTVNTGTTPTQGQVVYLQSINNVNSAYDGQYTVTGASGNTFTIDLTGNQTATGVGGIIWSGLYAPGTGGTVTPFGASTVAWNTFQNWYGGNPTPTSQPYNTYSKFVHYSTIDGTDSRKHGGTPIFINNQAYGFSLDENPNGPYTGTEVPSKFDQSIADGSTLTLTLNPWTASTPSAPTVVSIDTRPPQTSPSVPTPTAPGTVTWDVVFNEPVTGVSAANFALVASAGLTGSGNIQVSPASTASAAAWTVTANTGTGSGTLGLNLANIASIKDASGHALATGFTGEVYAVSEAPPVGPTASIAIPANAQNPTSAATVTFDVTFSQPVTGLSAANFTPITTGGVIGATVGPVTGSGTTYTIPVNTGSGAGTLALQLLAPGTGITPTPSGLPVTSAAYTIRQTPVAPALQSISRNLPNPTNQTQVSWTVSFSEPVTGVNGNNFNLVSSGLRGAKILNVVQAPGTGTAWNVTALTGSGTGTLRLDMVNSKGISDTEGLTPTGIPLQGQVYDVVRGDAAGVSIPIGFWAPQGRRANLVWPRGLPPFSGPANRVLNVTLAVTGGAGVLAASRGIRGVTVAGTGTGSEISLSGTVQNLNTYFRTAGRIGYTPSGESLLPRVLSVSATPTTTGGLTGFDSAAILIRGRGPAGVPAINPRATGFSTPAGTPLVITYAQLVTATGATTANSRSVEFLLGGVSSGRLEFWDGAKWIRVPAVLPKFKEPILAPGGQIRWTPPAKLTGQRPAFRAIAWDGWKMSATQSQVSVDVT